MRRQGPGGPRDDWPRAAVIAAGWTLAVLWTGYLISASRPDDPSGFGLAVKVMGSIGVLYALFLVLRPRGRGVLEFGAVRRRELQAAEAPLDAPVGNGARWGMVTLVVALAIGSIAYRLMQPTPMHQTAAFFIGVPAVMAITLAFTPKARSATGSIVKGLTLALLLSGVVFLEGFVCIAMASPLFYLVGILIGALIDRARRRRQSELRVYSIVGLGMLLLSAEGLTPQTTFPRIETVSVARVVDASPAEVRTQLASTPVFDEELPLYLRLGFPRPRAGYGSGLHLGDTRVIVFGDESPMEPLSDAAGHAHAAPTGETAPVLELEVVRSGPGLVAFEPVRDATPFTHWISWGRSVVEWEAAGGGRTEVTWTLTFRRKLSPAWYFAPMQRYAARLATGYLVDTIATP